MNDDRIPEPEPTPPMVLRQAPPAASRKPASVVRVGKDPKKNGRCPFKKVARGPQKRTRDEYFADRAVIATQRRLAVALAVDKLTKDGDVDAVARVAVRYNRSYQTVQSICRAYGVRYRQKRRPGKFRALRVVAELIHCRHGSDLRDVALACGVSVEVCKGIKLACEDLRIPIGHWGRTRVRRTKMGPPTLEERAQPKPPKRMRKYNNYHNRPKEYAKRNAIAAAERAEKMAKELNGADH